MDKYVMPIIYGRLGNVNEYSLHCGHMTRIHCVMVHACSIQLNKNTQVVRGLFTSTVLAVYVGIKLAQMTNR